MPLLQIGVKWGKEALEVEVDTSAPVELLKAQLYALTQVPPERQKIMGVKGARALAPRPWRVPCCPPPPPALSAARLSSVTLSATILFSCMCWAFGVFVGGRRRCSCEW